MNTLRKIKATLEYFQGVSDSPPEGIPLPPLNSLLWGLWWGALGIAIVLFCGQTSKFIYIDF